MIKLCCANCGFCAGYVSVTIEFICHYCTAEREFFKAYFGRYTLKKSDRTSNETATFQRMRDQQELEDRIQMIFHNDEALVIDKNEIENV